MSKMTRARKWASENPEVLMYSGALMVMAGLTLWARHAIKTAEPFPVAYHFERLDENTMRVFRLLENDTMQSRLFIAGGA